MNRRFSRTEVCLDGVTNGMVSLISPIVIICLIGTAYMYGSGSGQSSYIFDIIDSTMLMRNAFILFAAIYISVTFISRFCVEILIHTINFILMKEGVPE